MQPIVETQLTAGKWVTVFRHVMSTYSWNQKHSVTHSTFLKSLRPWIEIQLTGWRLPGLKYKNSRLGGLNVGGVGLYLSARVTILQFWLQYVFWTLHPPKGALVLLSSAKFGKMVEIVDNRKILLYTAKCMFFLFMHRPPPSGVLIV